MRWGLGVYAVLVCAVLIPPAAAQSYPSRPITVVVRTAAGGAADAIARNVGAQLSRRLGQPIVIENKPGGHLAPQQVASAAPDGHTLLFAPEATFVINPYLYEKLPYDPVKDFAPITGLVAVYQVIAGHPSLPASDIAGLIALAKAKPGTLNYGTFGLGSSGHLNMEAFQTATGTKLMPVHYRGAGPAFSDVIAGHIPMMFVSFGSTVEVWKAGKVKLLGIGRPKRLERFPELPTIAESGIPNFESKAWFGLFAPGRTPPEIVARINAEVRDIFADPEFRDKFLDANQMEPLTGSPEQLTELLRAESLHWQNVIRQTGVKLN